MRRPLAAPEDQGVADDSEEVAGVGEAAKPNRSPKKMAAATHATPTRMAKPRKYSFLLKAR